MKEYVRGYHIFLPRLFLVAFVSLVTEVPGKIFGFMQSVTVVKGILWGLVAVAIGINLIAK